ncbi:hypothetical protein ACVNHC_17160, partial [Pannonibacter sp. Q-1]
LLSKTIAGLAEAQSQRRPRFPSFKYLIVKELNTEAFITQQKPAAELSSGHQSHPVGKSREQRPRRQRRCRRR